ncbi:LamG-like jellyroll fold domain-containing protein [Paenibacillus sp. HB172176]|uniref:LamG-like jellyroll fold domain-containing protein n=1 Tax=Paenibacillus sp. HB172176 TaxID=2493690 RepID=UPI00143BEBD2|nr:LamG-like jellyroll fold domain-containing protein [Paenibacillus sp. HB172176]
MRRVLSAVLAAILVMAAMLTSVPKAEASGITYYVDAANGNDSTGNGSSGSPWKTIGKAAGIAAAGDTVLIRSGTYRETVTPVNSGTSGNPITYKADTGATVEVSGLDSTTATWAVYSGDVYKANIPMDLGPGNQVFYDDNLMMEARWPNSGNTDATDNTFLLEPTLATADTGTATVTKNMELTSNFLIGSWQFEDDLSESSGNEHEGVGYDLSYVAGSYDGSKAASFNGASSYAYIPERDIYSFKNWQHFTISAWIKTTSVNAPILSKGRYDADSDLEYRLYVDGNGKLAFERYCSDCTQKTFTVIDSDGASINDGQWHQVAFVQGDYEGIVPDGRSHRLYVDGNLVQEDNQTWHPNVFYEEREDRDPITVGRYKNDTISDTYFNGQIDDVRIYKTSLPGEDILHLDTHFIKGLWKFENNADDATDFSNNGTGSNVSYVDDGAVSEHAGSFNGTNSYISVPDSPSLAFGDPSDPFTLSAWVKTTTGGTILSKGVNNSSSVDYRLYINRSAAGNLGFSRLNGSSGVEVRVEDTSGVNLKDNNWHHVAFVNENASSHKLYIDGNLVETSTQTWSGNLITSDPLYVGRYHNVAIGGDYYYKGLIDQVTIYGKQLLSDEIVDYSDIVDSDLPAGIDFTGTKIHQFTFPLNGFVTYTTSVLTHSENTIRTPYLGTLNVKNKIQPNSAYYLFGNKDLLDAPREWFFESSTSTLYFYKPGGGMPDSSKVEIKKRTIGIDLSDKSFIQIENINLTASTIESNENTSDCTIDGMTAKYVSHDSRGTANAEGQAVFFYQKDTTGINISGSNNTLKNSEIAYSSGTGIRISGSGIQIVNNYIHDMDYIGSYAPALGITRCSSCLISHNTLTRAGRQLIYAGSPRANLIQYNDISSTGFLNADTGVVYSTAASENTRFYRNFIHDAGQGNSSIYLDNNASGFILDNNVFRNDTGEGKYAITLNLPQEYTLVFNNSVDEKIGPWASVGSGVDRKFKYDSFGTMLLNNSTKLSIRKITPQNLSMPQLTAPSRYNLENATVYASSTDYHLQGLPNGAAAIDQGISIEGVTDGYVGNAPDFGAYEYGGSDWTAGHDFENPPSPVYAPSNVEFMNRVSDSSFEEGNLTKWTVQNGSNTSVNTSTNWWSNAYAKSRLGGSSLKLGNGLGGEVTQTVAGLTAGRTYRAAVWVRVDDGETAELAVDGFGGSALSVSQGYTENTWKRLELIFTAGSTNTSAVLHVKKTSAGNKNVYFDDAGLQQLMAFEEFEDGVANNWDGVKGTWSIATNGTEVYRQTPDAYGIATTFYNAVWNDAEIEADITPSSFSGGNVSLNLRYADENNKYAAQLYQGNTLRLYKVVNGQHAILQQKSYTLNTGTAYRVKFSAVGSTLKMYVNGVEELSTTDTSLAAGGKAGLVVYNAAADFDNVMIHNK